ncbi:MAG TPA: hypothetical protein VLG47_01315 [Candidatus Saccharimonadales bacterium]|nr:hypothetical protein [Candidatus Saccharimonadales bacterium]
MAGLPKTPNGLVAATMHDGAGDFLRRVSVDTQTRRPKGALFGPVFAAEFSYGGATALIRRHLGDRALVIVEPQQDGRDGENHADGLSRAAAGAKLDAMLLRPDSSSVAAAYISAIQKVNQRPKTNVGIIVGPPRAMAYSEIDSEARGFVDATWNGAFQAVVEEEDGVRNFYLPGGVDGQVNDEVIDRIGRWAGYFSGALDPGTYSLWLDSVVDSENGMAPIFAAVGHGVNMNVFAQNFGTFALGETVLSVKREYAAFTKAG